MTDAPHDAPHDSKRAVIAAFLANLGIAIIKFVAYLFTFSSSMLSESIHSLADTGNQALLLLGRRRANRPPDEHHPFGYGPVRYFYSFIVAFVLFTLGGLFSIYEGIDKLRHPHELDSLWWAVAVLLGSMVMEGLLVPNGCAGSEPHPAHGRDVVAVHPPHQEPRPAGGVARGRRRAHRPRVRARRAYPSPVSPETPAGTASAAS